LSVEVFSSSSSSSPFRWERSRRTMGCVVVAGVPFFLLLVHPPTTTGTYTYLPLLPGPAARRRNITRSYQLHTRSSWSCCCPPYGTTARCLYVLLLLLKGRECARWIDVRVGEVLVWRRRDLTPPPVSIGKQNQRIGKERQTNNKSTCGNISYTIETMSRVCNHLVPDSIPLYFWLC
jgi:hypothetical protein